MNGPEELTRYGIEALDAVLAGDSPPDPPPGFTVGDAYVVLCGFISLIVADDRAAAERAAKRRGHKGTVSGFTLVGPNGEDPPPYLQMVGQMICSYANRDSDMLCDLVITHHEHDPDNFAKASYTILLMAADKVRSRRCRRN